MNEAPSTQVAQAAILNLIKELLPKKESTVSHLTFFNDLNDEEKLLSSVVIQATDIIESLRDFVDCIEEVDSYMSSLHEVIKDVSVQTKNKVINSIITDALLLGGFGYDVKVKSLER